MSLPSSGSDTSQIDGFSRRSAFQRRSGRGSARGHRLFPAFWLGATTGMRRGEVIGLRWSDVDLVAGTLSVHRSVTCAGYRLCETNGKTRNARRVIDIDGATVEVLVEWRRRQTDEVATAAVDEDPYVFTRPDGRVLHPHLLSQAFDRLVAHVGVPRIRLHDLRLTHAGSSPPP